MHGPGHLGVLHERVTEPPLFRGKRNVTIGFFPQPFVVWVPVFQNDPTPGSLFLMFLGDNGHH